jgi:hypothetical protein
MIMTEIVEKRWWAYSKKNPIFDIMGYSKWGGDEEQDASKAMETLSKYLGDPIPSDVELCIIADEQLELETESYSG